MKKFSLITAFTKKGRGIGFQNKLPWQNPKYNLPRGIPEDFKYFQDVTTLSSVPELKNSVIMGRRTFESMECRPLKNRINFVLTSQQNYCKSGNIIVCSSLNHAINHPAYQGCDKAFIIGGSSLYREAMDHELCDRVYVTEVDKEFEYDTTFPEIKDNFALEDEKLLLSRTGINLNFKTYKNMYDIQSDENQYLTLVKDIMERGEVKTGRNGDVVSLFGPQHIFDLQKGFPLLTTKRMFFSGIIKELLFFLRGETDAKILDSDGVKIWNGNTTREFLDDRGLTHYKEGDMGPMYGWNWRHFGTSYSGCDADYTDRGYDQLKYLIDDLINNPSSRRLLLTTYDPSKVSESVLAPCHGITIQFYVREGKFLDCKMYQRSVDVALGYPFNIASYALLVHILCHVTGYQPGKLVMTLGDTHIYKQHIDKVKNQLDRVPYQFPQLHISKTMENVNTKDIASILKFIEELKPDDFEINGYKYYPGIKMDMVA